MSTPYVDRKTVNESYRPKSNIMSPGLQRAREPFKIRNAITGLVLASFAVGVWAYSISAVKQDDFSDVDEEAKALASSSTRTAEPTASEVVNVTTGAIASGITSLQTTTSSPTAEVARPSSSGRPKGVIAALLAERYPKALDPKNGTLVFGAPSVDRPGRLRDNWRK
ncbi:hypothetical protein QCA50_000884 [Cerrena zonata]|uniref:Cytochrome c oxidase assembly factor 3 n=1 Tax=Cerrena zonata TaxID=2478898 RepID=A0AAW0GRU8_9APHY